MLQEPCIAGSQVAPPHSLRRNVKFFHENMSGPPGGGAIGALFESFVDDAVDAVLESIQDHRPQRFTLYPLMYTFVGPTKLCIYQFGWRGWYIFQKYCLGARVLMIPKHQILRFEVTPRLLVLKVTVHFVDGSQLKLEVPRGARKNFEQVVAATLERDVMGDAKGRSLQRQQEEVLQRQPQEQAKKGESVQSPSGLPKPLQSLSSQQTVTVQPAPGKQKGSQEYIARVFGSVLALALFCTSYGIIERIGDAQYRGELVFWIPAFFLLLAALVGVVVWANRKASEKKKI